MENPFENAREQDIVIMLEMRIRNEINSLDVLDDGSEEKARAVKNIVELTKLWRELTKEPEEDVKAEKKDVWDRVIDISKVIAVPVATIVVACIGYSFDNTWMERGYEFEEKGEIKTSNTHRTFDQKKFGARR